MALNKKSGKNLTFQEFDDIKVSTKTFIIYTNMVLNLKKLFEYLPITEYTVVPKKRGRKKKLGQPDQPISIECGSIVTMKYENQLRGVELKQKKSHSKTKKSKWFRNSFTVVMILENKPINFKVCQNGVFQVTGCKFDKHAEECIKYIWHYIKDQKDIYNFTKGDQLEILFIPAMRNIDFSLGFNIDREKLSKYMSTQTEFHSLLETSFGYTGVNIKLPIEKSITTMTIKRLRYQCSDKEEHIWNEDSILYEDYLTKLPEKERLKKLNKERFNTFLVFHSGRVIFSGICAELMRDSYYYFLKIIRTSYDIIEERLDV
jgi:hypothetical protein